MKELNYSPVMMAIKPAFFLLIMLLIGYLGFQLAKGPPIKCLNQWLPQFAPTGMCQCTTVDWYLISEVYDPTLDGIP